MVISWERIQGLICVSLANTKWKITAFTPSETESPKYVLECEDVQVISGEYWEVTEEWFATFYKKLKSKRLELTETFSIECVENPEGEEIAGTYILILCSDRKGSALGWFITRNEPQENGILVGVCPDSYVNKVRDNESQLNLLVEFVKHPNNFRDISVGISS